MHQAIYDISDETYSVEWNIDNPIPLLLKEKIDEISDVFEGEIITTHFNGVGQENYDWGVINSDTFYFEVDVNLMSLEYFMEIVNDLVNGDIKFIKTK